MRMVDAYPGVDETDIKTGERIMQSPLTGNFYLVTKWVDKGDGKAQSLEKELLEGDELDAAIDRIEDAEARNAIGSGE